MREITTAILKYATSIENDKYNDVFGNASMLRLVERETKKALPEARDIKVTREIHNNKEGDFINHIMVLFDDYGFDITLSKVRNEGYIMDGGGAANDSGSLHVGNEDYKVTNPSQIKSLVVKLVKRSISIIENHMDDIL